MRRVVLVVGLVIGIVTGLGVPVSGLGLISVTLTCSDGTSVTMNVDTDTLNSLTDSVNAMTLYPAGLSCSLVQNPVNPLGGFFGNVANAASSNAFLVGGGRWQLPCIDIGFQTGIEGGQVARVPGSWSYWAGPLSLEPTAQTDDLVWVNIAVNVQQDGNGNFFGTLNETIPENQACFGQPVGESHFQSTPICLTSATDGTIVAPASRTAPVFVTSRVTNVAGQVVPFPGDTTGVTQGTASAPQYVHFGFQDNANPPGQNPTATAPTTDMVNGPPAFIGSSNVSACAGPDPTTMFNLGAADGSKQYGNLTLHPAGS